MARLAMDARPKPRIRPYYSLQMQEGVALVGPKAAVEAIEAHIADKYGDDGSAATWALRMVVSESRAAALGGSAGEQVRITEEATWASAMALGKLVAKVPGRDVMPCEVLQLMGGKAVARIIAALTCRTAGLIADWR